METKTGIVKFTEELIKKYKLAPNSYCKPDEHPWKDRKYLIHPKEVALKEKWTARVVDGFYGFSITPAPDCWFDVIDEWLEVLEKDSPNFKIKQIKGKYQFCVFYLENLSENAKQALTLLENVLQEKKLIK